MRPSVGLLVAIARERRAVQEGLRLPSRGTLEGIPLYAEGGVCALQTGVGVDRAAEAARILLTALSPAALISTGFACGLKPGMSAGDLILADAVFLDSPTPPAGESLHVREFHSDPGLFTLARRAATVKRIPVIQGSLLTVSHLVTTVREKAEIAARWPGVVALDMESAAVAAVAWRLGVPFVVLRTVSDTVEQPLPVALTLLTPRGTVRPSTALWAWFHHPVALTRAGWCTRRAAASLARFLRTMIEAVRVVPPSP